MKRKAQFLSNFWLKIIGLVVMALDHIGVFMGMFYSSASTIGKIGMAFRCVGRLALPIFIFLLVEGLRKAKNPEKYLLRIFIVWAGFFAAGLTVFIAAGCGLIIEPFADMAGSLPANAFNDLMYVGLFLFLLDNKHKKLRPLCVIPLLIIIISYVFDVLGAYGNETLYLFFPEFIRADYSIFALLLGLGFYYAKPLSNKLADKALLYETDDEEIMAKRQGLENLLNLGVLVVAVVICYALSFIYGSKDPLHFSSIGSFALISGAFLIVYNGKRGYDAKWFRWFSYLYYPVHIAIIALVFILLSI